MTSDEAPLRWGGGMQYAPLALPRRRLLLPALALGGLLLAGCATTKNTSNIIKDIDYPAMERKSRAAVGEQPDDGFNHESLGYALWKQGKYEEAEKEYREAVRLLRDSTIKATANGRLAVVIANQGRFIEAEKVALQGVHLTPNNPWVHYYLACCYALWDRKEDAIKSLQTADEKGFLYWPGLKKDKELREIRTDPRFMPIASHVRARWVKYTKPNVLL